MRHIADDSGRFAERPHYAAHELDWMFERIATDLLKEGGAPICFPLSTVKLISLIERAVEQLGEHDSKRFDGATEFLRNGRPRVTVAKKLTRSAKYAAYLRTVLAHEYAHLHLHHHLYELSFGAATIPGSENRFEVIGCRRKTMTVAATGNWMEWQASYASGALLMPATYVKQLTAGYLAHEGLDSPVASDSDHGEVLIDLIVKSFLVCRDAARVRLSALKILGPPVWTLTPYLFPLLSG